MVDAYQEIQEDLFDYFKDVDNKMLSDFIDVFVYHNITTDSKISKLSEKFLEDNGLTNAYINYMHDRDNPKQYFRRASMSDSSMVDQIKSALLSIAYNRFRKVLDNPTPKHTTKPKNTPKPIFSKLNKDEKS